VENDARDPFRETPTIYSPLEPTNSALQNLPSRFSTIRKLRPKPKTKDKFWQDMAALLFRKSAMRCRLPGPGVMLSQKNSFTIRPLKLKTMQKMSFGGSMAAPREGDMLWRLLRPGAMSS